MFISCLDFSHTPKAKPFKCHQSLKAKFLENYSNHQLTEQKQDKTEPDEDREGLEEA